MTKFLKAEFEYHGGYLTYGRYPLPHDQRKFVARFKYGRGGYAHFRDFLIKNFTVEEYFTARATDEGEGLTRMPPAPLTILERKGYVSPNQAAACRAGGFPVTRDGYKAAINAIVERSHARMLADKEARTHG